MDQTSVITSLIWIQKRVCACWCVWLSVALPGRSVMPTSSFVAYVSATSSGCELRSCTTSVCIPWILIHIDGLPQNLLFVMGLPQDGVLPSCSWWPLISFFAIYFQALMWCSVTGWGSSLGASAWLLFMWSGPKWSGIWLGLLGPRLGAGRWSAASLECQTFEVRHVKKEPRLVGVWSNRRCV